MRAVIIKSDGGYFARREDDEVLYELIGDAESIKADVEAAASWAVSYKKGADVCTRYKYDTANDVYRLLDKDGEHCLAGWNGECWREDDYSHWYEATAYALDADGEIIEGYMLGFVREYDWEPKL